MKTCVCVCVCVLRRSVIQRAGRTVLCLEWDRFPTEELQLEEAAEAQSGAGGGALAEGAESPGRPRYLVSDSLCEMFPVPLCA